MGKEWVKASQLRWTSKSVDLLLGTISMDGDARWEEEYFGLLCGEEKDLQCRGDNGALGD